MRFFMSVYVVGAAYLTAAFPASKAPSSGFTNRTDPVVINVDAARYGCGPGQLAVLDTCQDLDFHVVQAAHDRPGEECSAAVCAPGQWFDGERCQSIIISTNATQCSEGAEAKGNQVCVNDALQTIETGYDGNSCGPTKQVCSPGRACYQDRCIPITVGSAPFSIGGRSRLEAFFVSTDTIGCDSNYKDCETESLCLDHECPTRLEITARTDLIRISLDRAWCGDSTAPPCEHNAVCISGACLSPSDGFSTREHRQSVKCSVKLEIVEDVEAVTDQDSAFALEDQDNADRLGQSGHSIGGAAGPYNEHTPSFCPAGSLRFKEGERCSKISGDPLSCSGNPCPPESLCCDGRCLALDLAPSSSGSVGSELKSGATECPGGCSDGHFCFGGTCHKAVIVSEGQCSPRGCSAGQACLAGALCVQLAGDDQSCGTEGRCPEASRCILGSCVTLEESRPEAVFVQGESTSALGVQTTSSRQRPSTSASAKSSWTYSQTSAGTSTSSTSVATSSISNGTSNLPIPEATPPAQVTPKVLPGVVSKGSVSPVESQAIGNEISPVSIAEITSQAQITPDVVPGVASKDPASSVDYQVVDRQQPSVTPTKDFPQNSITEPTPLGSLTQPSEGPSSPATESAVAEATMSNSPPFSTKGEAPISSMRTSSQPASSLLEEEAPQATHQKAGDLESDAPAGPETTDNGASSSEPIEPAPQSPTEGAPAAATPEPIEPETFWDILFATADTNDDEFITFDEFLEFGSTLGVTEEEYDLDETRIQFAEADMDNDGLLSKSEFIAGIMAQIPEGSFLEEVEG